MGAVLLALGVGTTHDLQWPADPDLYRDIAQAQTIADGSLLDDPYYRGETLWHNPLAPLVVAMLSKGFAQPVPATYVRAGAYLNLLGVIAFYLWIARIAGAPAATAATLGFVFYRDTWAPAWVAAAYSPWLFAMTSSQAPFYFGLLAYRGMLMRGGRGRAALSGALLGLTFLAAAAPALILGGVILAGAAALAAGGIVSASSAPRARARILGVAADHAVLALWAVAVASPLLYSIVWRYRLHVRNAAPTLWEWAGLTSFSDFAAVHAAWPVAVALIGAAVLLSSDSVGRVDAVIMAAFGATAAALLGYRHVLGLAGIALPQFVPSHYFVFYLKALQWALVGVAVGAAVSRLPVAPAALRWALPAATALVLVAAVPPYRTRGYFQSAREAALVEASRRNLREAYEWIREHTSPGDVFLCSPELALQVVGPAGRKVVVAGEVYSNPYVDWAARSRSSAALWRSLREGGGPALRGLARESEVRYVIHSRQEDAGIDDLLAEAKVAGLEPAFKSGGLRIHRLTAP